MTDSGYRDALAAIHERSGYDRGFISNPFAGDEAARRGLLRTRRLLDTLGGPDGRYGIVHVAGSKGKGSTCVFIDTILRAAGHRVGRSTSPHLHSFRERYTVDGEPIDEGAFARLTFSLLDVARRIERDDSELGEITAFELTTALGLAWFAERRCDLAVVEVGLGGLLDATNVVTPLVSVIAPLDYEHTAVLGTTLTEIARNKAGIIKEGRPVVVSRQDPEALAVIEATAAEKHSTMLLAGRDWRTQGTWQQFRATGPWDELADLRTSLPGQHQVDNAGLALAACAVLTEGGWQIGQDAMRTGLATAIWPGRFEEVDLEGRVVIDGAHTPASARALADALAERYPGQRATFIVGLFRDKDPAAFAAPLAPLAERWLVTAPANPRVRPAAELAAALEHLTAPVCVADSVADAIAAARRSGAPLIVVTGSLSMVAAARVALGLATDDPAPSG